jgi:hypothetical protein
MSFYVGAYLILSDSIDPKHDRDSWELPDVYGHQGHMADTSNVEELLIKPEDMDLIPTQIQFGLAEYSADDGDTSGGLYTQFYVKTQEKFYVRVFVGTDYFTESFYPNAEPAWYTRSFTGTDYFTESFYPNSEPAWYVRGFTGTDYFTESFYPNDEPAWYLRGFTPTNFFSEFYAADYP